MNRRILLRESGNEFHLSIYLCQKENFKILVLEKGFQLSSFIGFKLLFKLRNILQQTESRSCLACNQNVKEHFPAALEVFLCFETKRNDIKRSCTKTSTQSRSNIRATKLGAMSKNNSKGITLVRRPIWKIRSLTLMIISWWITILLKIILKN